MARKLTKKIPIVQVVEVVAPISYDLVKRAYTLMRQKEEAYKRKLKPPVKSDSALTDNKTGESL